MIRVSARTIGVAEAQRRLTGLPKRIRNRTIRSGLRRIGSVVAKALKPLLPGVKARDGRVVSTGATKRSIGARVKTYKAGAVVAIGPRSGFETEVRDGTVTSRGRTRVVKRATKGRRKHNPTRTFHLIDRGTKHFRGKHYLRRARNAAQGQFVTIMREEVDKVLREKGNS